MIPTPELEKELAALKRQKTDQEQILNSLKADISALDKKIKAAESRLKARPAKNLQVTDHAVLRYIERKHGFNVSEIRKQITEKLRGAEKLGAVEAMGFVVKGGAVITFLGDSSD